MDPQDLPIDDNGIPGCPRTTKSRVLEAGASMVQDFTPVKQICAHLHAFHIYASDPTRCVEANHYCAHITEGINITISDQFTCGKNRKRLTRITMDRRPAMSPLRQRQAQR